LIEVVAAVLLTAIVISVAVAFQINLGSAMQSARERLRTDRQAIALLDRIERDLRGAYYIVPREGGNQRAHPWVFLTTHDFVAEDENSDGLKFITRNYQPRSLDGHASDLAVVAYYLSPMEDVPAYQMLRWRSTHMPQTYDPEFPGIDDPDAYVIGEGITRFGFSMIDDKGTEVPKWDSVLAGARKGLPIAVRLEISMLDPRVLEEAQTRDDFDPAFDDVESESEPQVFSKLVPLPLRPLDWSFLESDTLGTDLPQGDEAEDGDEDSDEDGGEADERDDDDDDEDDDFRDN